MAMEPKRYMGLNRKKKSGVTLDTSKIAKNPNKGNELMADGLPRNFNDLPQAEREALIANLDAPAEQAPVVKAEVPRTVASAADTKKESRPISQTATKEVGISATGDVVSETNTETDQTREKPKKDISSTFKRAITQLAPSAIGMLVGSLLEGSEGGVEGYEKGTALTNQLQNLSQQEEQMAVAAQNAETQRMFAENQRDRMSQSDKSKKRLSTNWVDANNNPVLEVDGIPVDDNGNPIPTDQLKRYSKPITLLEEARIRNYENVAKNREFKQDQANEADAQRALKDMRATEEYKQSSKMLTTVPTIRGLISDAVANGGQSLAMLGPKVAKGIAGEVGVLTEQDVKRYIQDPSLAGSVRDSLLKMKSGKLSEVSAENLTRLVDIMEVKANDQIKKAVDREATLFSRRSGLSKQEARKLIDETSEISGQKPEFNVQSMEERKTRLKSKLFTR